MTNLLVSLMILSSSPKMSNKEISKLFHGDPVLSYGLRPQDLLKFDKNPLGEYLKSPLRINDTSDLIETYDVDSMESRITFDTKTKEYSIYIVPVCDKGWMLRGKK